MRKMMNKKGFSLVELMIVVVIMGILIAVAIPLYGAITANANNKTCATNIETIKTAAANYYASYDQDKADVAALESMMDDGELPACPLGGSYTIAINANGSATVQCHNTEDSHSPEGSAAPATGAETIQTGAAASATT